MVGRIGRIFNRSLWAGRGALLAASFGALALAGGATASGPSAPVASRLAAAVARTFDPHHGGEHTLFTPGGQPFFRVAAVGGTVVPGCGYPASCLVREPVAQASSGTAGSNWSQSTL